MKPSDKGWLKEYLEFRKNLFEGVAEEGRVASHPEHALYRLIHPTGIMYGQPVRGSDQPGGSNWDQQDKMKVLLAESLISSALLFHGKPITSPEEVSAVTMKTVESIGSFYNHVFPELATPTKTLFGRKKSPLELAERILEKRIERTREFSSNFWTQFFHNSLLFLDVFIFGQWIHTNADRIVSDFFKYEREELRTALVRVMAAAAHANHIVEFEERKLLEFFLQGAQLPPEKKKECQEIFTKGLSVEELQLPTNNSWILQKYFLEIAILTIWADKKVDKSEVEFLDGLARHLGFHADDLENSMLAVEGFILEHWKELNHLQDKKSFKEVSEQYIERLSRITEKNKSRLIKEVRASEDLVDLLSEARKRELNETEQEQLRDQLVQTLRSIPTFVIISLPQRYLTLPILMQILPKNFIADSLSSN